jgi:hypothetical protein
MRQNQKDLEHPEGGGGDREEIYRHQVPGMVLEEALPRLGTAVVMAFGSILAEGGIGDRDAEFGQFSLDALA